MLRFGNLIFLVLAAQLMAGGPGADYWNEMVGSAFVENASYQLLQRMCDEGGGRLVGSPQNERAQAILVEALKKLNLTVRRESFTIPGWERGDDRVEMIAPTARTLRVVALGYVDKTPEFTADLVAGFSGQARILDSLDVQGKVVLITPGRPKKGERPLRSQVIQYAARNGARAVLFVNNKNGGLRLAGTSSFQGEPAPIPAFSLSKEEGLWLNRLLKKGKRVRLRVVTNSHCKKVTTSNVVATIPGKSSKKIVLGAHFDSWDLGQGSIDNGLGSAILFEVARLISTIHPQNYFTLEFVWFNGEELGLWGSKQYMKKHASDSIVAMINMDMTGRPTGVNVMGFKDFMPFFENFVEALPGFSLNRGVVNQPWTNSDHMPFLMRGIPVFSLTAHLDPEMGRYYHSVGDTFDKVRADYLSQASAVIALMATEMANNTKLPYRRLTKDEVIKLLTDFKLDKILKKEKEWVFE